MVVKTLEELSVPELKRELKNRDLSDKGEKAELVDRFREALEMMDMIRRRTFSNSSMNL